ncbi:hypothetical protein WME95_06495 [Sorangium sp. So ce327]|uniref:hypothetical protein n=1 Tax=Sorangium sp. So ce327 TaxID=3133301 RepID=UPI003F62D4D6
MSIRVHDRLGAIDEARSGAALLGRFVVREGAPGELFMNSFPAHDGMFLVPESAGRWHLLRGSERVEGTFPRNQMLDPLDAASIRTVGRSLGELVDQSGTWLDMLDVSPLVPGMSNRAEFQRFEQLLKENVGHLEEVCRRPRTHLRVEVERMAVSRARRFPAQAANYLAAHTEDWERPTLRSVVPRRILATVREDQCDIYENRVAVRLVDHLVVYLRRRVHEVTRLLRVFEEAGGNHGAAAGGSHWRRGRIYKLWGETLDASEAKRKAERTLGQLKHLLFTISGLKDSALYREVPRRATVGTTLTMTNILSDDAHYRRVAELWLGWARLGQERAVRPRAYLEEMQDLCRSFDSFALLLTLRALDHLGFEPINLERSLADREAEVRHGSRVARLWWGTSDGAISLQGEGIEPLRIVPLCSSLAALDDEQLRGVLADADAHAGTGATTVILYPSPSEAAAFEHLAPELAVRLRSLAHEAGRDGRRGVGFLPVSPWDIGSVERMARQLRWVTTAPAFLAYPPTIARPELSELSRGHTWLEVVGNQLRIVRAPLENDALPARQFVDDAAAQLKRLEEERESVSLKLREAVRDRGATGAVNARKKELNAEITYAEKRLEALRRFERDLANAVGLVDDLLGCPTCKTRADARRDFKPMGQHFSCTCSDCSTTWGTIACGRCARSIPVLRLHGTAWTTLAGEPGWVDRTLGADVLAVPWVVGAEIGFVCPSCGHCRRDALTAA